MESHEATDYPGAGQSLPQAESAPNTETTEPEAAYSWDFESSDDMFSFFHELSADTEREVSNPPFQTNTQGGSSPLALLNIVSNVSDLECIAATRYTWVNTCVPKIYFSPNFRYWCESDVMELLSSSVEILEDFSVTPRPLAAPCEAERLEFAVQAQNLVVRNLCMNLEEVNRCEEMTSKLDELESNAGICLDILQSGMPHNGRSEEAVTTLRNAIKENVSTLRNWNRESEFIFRKWGQFSNVSTSKDLLALLKTPCICGICFSDIEESSDFAVQSECYHVFCTPCLHSWYQIQSNCPNCRQGSKMISKDSLIALLFPDEKSEQLNETEQPNSAPLQES